MCGFLAIFNQRIRMILFLALALILSGCGVVGLGGGPSTSCPAGTVQINVFDTQLQRVCGCTEPSGLYFSTAGSLACTLKVNTVVYFNYVGITIQHRMSIPSVSYSSPVRYPSANTQTDGYQFRSTGTFTFQDDFTSIGGIFTVIP